MECWTISRQIDKDYNVQFWNSNDVKWYHKDFLRQKEEGRNIHLENFRENNNKGFFDKTVAACLLTYKMLREKILLKMIKKVSENKNWRKNNNLAAFRLIL